MSAVGDLFSNQGGGNPPDGPSRGTRTNLDTLYFACKPEPDMAQQMELAGNRLCAKYGLLGKVSPTVLHMSLCGLGLFADVSEARIEAARKAAAGVVVKPFEAAFDRVRTVPNGKEKPPFVAFAQNGVPGAEFLRYALMGDLRRVGFTFPKNLPKPHMTLCYDRRTLAEEAIEPIRWTVREFVLVHSIFGAGRHVVLGQWPLRG